jgi:hypothetical protein
MVNCQLNLKYNHKSIVKLVKVLINMKMMNSNLTLKAKMVFQLVCFKTLIKHNSSQRLSNKSLLKLYLTISNNKLLLSRVF